MRSYTGTSTLMVLVATGCFYDPDVVASTEDAATGTSSATGGPAAPTTTTLEPACGDGTLHPGEQCDDGNLVNGDGCEDDCTNTPSSLCGNGELEPGEECDDGNDLAMDGCENNCIETEISANCGDGVFNGDEECDDGNTDNTDACTNTCKHAACGDGIVAAGVEACDDGEQNSDTAYDGCTTQCQLGPRCGDGVLQNTEGEQCDDSTPDGDDLCNNCTETSFRYIFVTSAAYKGDLNKLGGADIKCAAAADSANLPGNPYWTAWLSDNVDSPAYRMDNTFTGWYVLPGPELVLIARDWDGLTSGTLLNPINKDEAGNSIAADATVWSNTNAVGKILSLDAHCSAWDLNTGIGNVGDPNAADETWTNGQATSDCNSPHHIYCVQN